MSKQFKYEKGIVTRLDTVTTLENYQKDAEKFRNYRQLVMQEMECRKRIKQIGQERAKILGVTEKYKE